MKPEKFVSEIETVLKQNANAENAVAMSKYMKDLFPYYGIKKPLRTQLTKPLMLNVKKDITEDWIMEAAALLWKKKQREFHYVAMDLLNMNRKVITPKSFKALENLVLKNSWWDSVDSLSNYAISPLVLRYPELKKEMKHFAQQDNMWLKRVSIIHQLPYKTKTDWLFLMDVCKRHMHDKEFFIRKAIGWALRQHAKTDPKAVYAFVEANKAKLSNLSIREALKHK
jgi:3-methyladenine DNA glycosylase AlkD